MLVEFRGENHRSLREEQVLTMEAGRVGDESDGRPRRVQGYPEQLLTVAGLYGANASGKSNVLAALSFMREAVVLSHRFWSPDEEPDEPLVPRDPFAWGPKRREPSLFEVVLLLNGARYQYGFQASDEQFMEEWLYAWPGRRKQVWFERENQRFKFGDNLKGENHSIELVTRPNALFLSAAAQHNHPQLVDLFAWFRSIGVIGPYSGRPGLLRSRMASSRALANLLDADADQQPLLDEVRDLLKRADIGVIDLRVEDEPEKKRLRSGPSFSLKHQSDMEDAWLPLREESNGTQTLFYLALPVLRALQRGSVLLVDELEHSLHPALAKHIIDQFNDPATNPNNAQLIFTTHDTNLLGTMLGEPPLRRDQVWLTEKDSEGATVLYPLTDYKPRKAENLERGYLQGRYGAVPFLATTLVGGE
ncbi:MAG: ATP-binding protein [Thermoguttaceae bacterium]|jgi:hypothetical protein|nr:ATP-binding protein [Thermoguttaceae bacterium]